MVICGIITPKSEAVFKDACFVHGKSFNYNQKFIMEIDYEEKSELDPPYTLVQCG